MKLKYETQIKSAKTKYSLLLITLSILILSSCNSHYFSTLKKYKNVDIEKTRIAITSGKNICVRANRLTKGAVVWDTLQNSHKVKIDLLKELKYETNRLGRFDSISICRFKDEPRLINYKVKGYTNFNANIPDTSSEINLECEDIDFVLFLDEIYFSSHIYKKLGNPILITNPITTLATAGAAIANIKGVETVSLQCKYVLIDNSNRNVIKAENVSVSYNRELGDIFRSGRAWHFVGEKLFYDIFSDTPFYNKDALK